MPQGKCTRCSVAYRWKGKPLLRDAACRCGKPLAQTIHSLRTRWLEQVPPHRKTDGTGWLSSYDAREAELLANDAVLPLKAHVRDRIAQEVGAVEVTIEVLPSEHEVTLRATRRTAKGEHVALAPVLFPTEQAVTRALCGALGHALRPLGPHELRTFSGGTWVVSEATLERGRHALGAALGIR